MPAALGKNFKLLKIKGLVTPEKADYHAEILANRVRNRFRHLSRRFRKEGIECFRLYDWDMPEVRAVVDWYAGHIVVAEYERLQTGPQYLPQMAQAVAAALNLSPDKVHIKRRRTNTKEGPRYTKMSSRGDRFDVRERNLRFWVNLDDYLDTGLFSDHRNTRVLVSKMAAGKDFLNLFAYTGAFTCAAAAGGAKSTVTVERSETYINWTRDNLKLNNLWAPQHTLVKSDAGQYLAQASRERRRFTLAFVDPPSFSQDKNKESAFDVNRDHPQLIRDVLKVMVPGGIVIFSTNHQRFEPCLDNLPVNDLKELTPATIPEDYRNKLVHRCWQMTAV